MEPEKCAKWEWVPWTQMWGWAREQAEAERDGREVTKDMFRPLVNLVLEYPELQRALEGR
jgi:8-oxo-dGTP diphosphatase